MSTYKVNDTADHPVQLKELPPLGPQHHTTYAETDDLIYSTLGATDRESKHDLVITTERSDQPPTSYTKFPLYKHPGARDIDGWAAEVLSCALYTFALASLVFLLRFFDGHVVTEVPLEISINTLVAIIAAVVKSSIILPVAGGIRHALK